jgi:hypothetical protein
VVGRLDQLRSELTGISSAGGYSALPRYLPAVIIYSMTRLVPVLLFVLLACDRSASPPIAQEQQQGVVDSIFPTEEEIRRFKARVGGPFPTELENAASSRNDLARQFMDALEKGDATKLRKLVIEAREFISLYYPHSQFTRPPYKQSPALMWFLMSQNSEKGISRVLDRFAGRPTGYRALECKSEPIVQELNRIWDCQVRWTPNPGKPDPIKVFGAILEREGRFKFLSYANDL